MLIDTEEFKFRLLSDSWEKKVVIYISSPHFDDAGEKVRGEVTRRLADIGGDAPRLALCELQIADWDRYLTPWEADAGMKGRRFAGFGADLLDFLRTQVVPAITQQTNDVSIYLAGYSLAGLYALWCLMESDLFDGAACCSGSLWYPGWMEYARAHGLQKSGSVYLSLGKGEKNTKHPLMRQVEYAMKQQYEFLEKDCHVARLHMDWHEGGHFNNTEQRTAMGICWLSGDS